MIYSAIDDAIDRITDLAKVCPGSSLVINGLDLTFFILAKPGQEGAGAHHGLALLGWRFPRVHRLQDLSVQASLLPLFVR